MTNVGTGRVSILIVNWNTREAILRCLDALPASIDGELSYEVIVVDNGSVDGSADALKERADITLITNDENLGFAAAVNQAYTRSSGEFVLLLNSDVDLTSGSLSALVRFLLDHPHVAGVGPLYLNPDGSPQPFHFRLPRFAALVANSSSLVRRTMPGSAKILRDYRMLDDDFSAPLRVPQPSASCLLLRRSCLDGDRVFDERYPIFFNDVMLARNLFDRGLELWVTPEAVVVHEAHSSARQMGKSLRRQYLASIVRMLEETEPRRNVWFYRSIVFSQNVALGLSGNRRALRGGDLWGALAGDPGPLPTRPSRTGSPENEDAPREGEDLHGSADRADDRMTSVSVGEWAQELRRRRYRHFVTDINLRPGDTIIDVGAGNGGALCQFNTTNPIVALDLAPTIEQANVRVVVGDARELPFEDRSFDVCFSNSVLQYMVGEDRKRYAEEIRRVAGRYWVQAPYRFFPVDPHYLVPGIQFLPERTQRWLNSRVKLGWRAKGSWTPTLMPSVRELRRLFPDGIVRRERVFGLTKSLMVYRP